jgi:hypothetical protein
MSSTATLSVEDRLHAIEDKLELYTLLARYQTVVDAFDFKSMAGIFTPDGTLGNGARINSVSIFENIDPASLQPVAEMGLAHLSTPPYIKLGKNAAVAFSYSCVTVRDPAAESIDVPQHGSGRGHRLFMIAANRWDFVRLDGVWKVSRRQLIVCDGTDAPRELQRSVLSAEVD